MRWDPSAAATPLGQLPFFVEFFKLGGLFDPWMADCPLMLRSLNAPAKRDILGTLFLGGHHAQPSQTGAFYGFLEARNLRKH